MTTTAKLTAPQAAFLDRLPVIDPAKKEYVILRVSYRESRVAFRALQKMGWHGSYSGGKMRVWKHEEDFVDRRVISDYLRTLRTVNSRPEWALPVTATAFLFWLRKKFNPLVWEEGDESKGELGFYRR